MADGINGTAYASVTTWDHGRGNYCRPWLYITKEEFEEHKEFILSDDEKLLLAIEFPKELFPDCWKIVQEFAERFNRGELKTKEGNPQSLESVIRS